MEPQKPLSVARQETIDNITSIVNNCMLPPFVVESILKDLYTEVRAYSQKQYERDLEAYNQRLNEYYEEQQAEAEASEIENEVAVEDLSATEYEVE